LGLFLWWFWLGFHPPKIPLNGARKGQRKKGRKSPQGGRLSGFYRNVDNFLSLPY